jgi:hypothetical protein
MDHSTGAHGARWLDLMVTVELCEPDSAKTSLLLLWYGILKPFAFTKIASFSNVGTYQHEWLQTEGFFHKLESNPLFSKT